MPKPDVAEARGGRSPISQPKVAPNPRFHYVHTLGIPEDFPIALAELPCKKISIGSPKDSWINVINYGRRLKSFFARQQSEFNSVSQQV